MASVSLAKIIERFKLENLTPELDISDIKIIQPDINRPALQLAGYFEHYEATRLQIIGFVEYTYMDSMDDDRKLEIYNQLLSCPIPVIVFCRNLQPDPLFLKIALEKKIPLLMSKQATSAFTAEIIRWLNVELAPRISIHGVLVDIFGEGVLITGESGVGKELFAEQVHLLSSRANKPFIRVSCASLAPSLLESELFGHVKGAYTDASSTVKGRFEIADGGTLFLDEIGELPWNLQSKLLRVIQEKNFERVGSSETISVDVRIVAATNRDLEKMIQEKLFREDLYYRLNVLPISVPPLRERKEDLPDLCMHFLSKFKDETHKRFTGFSEAALNAIHSYMWPGNIRELENTIQRACILGKPPLIQVNDLKLPGNRASERGGSGEIASMASDIGSRGNKSLKYALDEFKKQYITKILIENNWNQTQAARVLDIQRTYVSKLISELGIKR